jgi:hypothetical protein
MNETRASDDYLNLLFAQDSLLNSQEFEEHRRKVIERLAGAQQQEKRARRITVIATVGCATLFIALYTLALLTMRSGANLPEWLVILIAMVIILLPVAALLLSSIYFFRYRWEFVRARREARSQALLEMPRQIADLRKELQELRDQLARERRAVEPQPKGTKTIN